MKSLDERINGLRWRLRAMRRLWSRGASPEMPFLARQRPRELGIALIDIPGPGAELTPGVVKVVGWSTFKGGPTSKVEVFLGEKQLGFARVGVPRADVERQSELPFAATAGFELEIGLEEIPGPRSTVRAVASGPGGERIEAQPVPVVIGDAAEDPPPMASGDTGAQAPPRGEKRGSGPKVMVVTHQLTLGGAQLYLMDLLRELVAREAIEPTVVTAMDGPLRKELEQMGVAVHVTNLAPAGSLAAHLGRAEDLAAWAAPHGFERVFVNTATSVVLPGGDAAAMLGIPAVWAVHESFEPEVLWAELPREVRIHARELLGRAEAVVFEADATREIFEEFVEPDRCMTIPYGLDLSVVDAHRAAFDPARARRRLEVPESAELMVCIGTVEARKAQIPLAVAFESIAARHPLARLAFIGGREHDPYSEALADLIEAAAHGDQMRLIPITPDVESWYGVADILVSASDVESLPRTVLEAMAWETPVLATSVYGLPELIDDGETGWLCPPRDLESLSAALDRVLATTGDERQRIGRASRELVEHRHPIGLYGREIAALLGSASHSR